MEHNIPVDILSIYRIRLTQFTRYRHQNLIANPNVVNSVAPGCHHYTETSQIPIEGFCLSAFHDEAHEVNSRIAIFVIYLNYGLCCPLSDAGTNAMKQTQFSYTCSVLVNDKSQYIPLLLTCTSVIHAFQPGSPNIPRLHSERTLPPPQNPVNDASHSLHSRTPCSSQFPLRRSPARGAYHSAGLHNCRNPVLDPRPRRSGPSPFAIKPAPPSWPRRHGQPLPQAPRHGRWSTQRASLPPPASTPAPPSATPPTPGQHRAARHTREHSSKQSARRSSYSDPSPSLAASSPPRASAPRTCVSPPDLGHPRATRTPSPPPCYVPARPSRHDKGAQPRPPAPQPAAPARPPCCAPLPPPRIRLAAACRGQSHALTVFRPHPQAYPRTSSSTQPPAHLPLCAALTPLPSKRSEPPPSLRPSLRPPSPPTLPLIREPSARPAPSAGVRLHPRSTAPRG
ncbi:unnamed protein product [Dicrocoelium dendriticum]|nr:unnamed protein product [Dicrocoelium dendriticum]